MTPDRKNEQELSLSDEQFAESLAHAGASEGALPQDEELRRVAGGLRSYRQQTTHWAERRSAGQPSLAERARREARWGSLPQWSLAAIALVTIAGGVTHFTGARATMDAPENSAAAVVEMVEATTPADIAEDNHLLSSIDAELSYHSASPVDELQLREIQPTHDHGSEEAD